MWHIMPFLLKQIFIIAIFLEIHFSHEISIVKLYIHNDSYCCEDISSRIFSLECKAWSWRAYKFRLKPLRRPYNKPHVRFKNRMHWYYIFLYYSLISAQASTYTSTCTRVQRLRILECNISLINTMLSF
jgi:hypothetical protein